MSTIQQQRICRSVRAVRNDPAMLSGFGAIILAISVIAGIVLFYTDRHELVVDLGRLMALPITQLMPADL